MNTLQPQSPGHWTEAVLLAFPDAVLTNDYPEAGVLHVTLILETDLEIEFKRDEFRLEDAPESFTATLMEYAPTEEDSTDLHLDHQVALYESTDIDILCESTRDWVEHYLEDTFTLTAFDSLGDWPS